MPPSYYVRLVCVGKDAKNDYMLNVCVDFINENIYNIFIRRIVI